MTNMQYTVATTKARSHTNAFQDTDTNTNFARSTPSPAKSLIQQQTLRIFAVEQNRR